MYFEFFSFEKIVFLHCDWYLWRKTSTVAYSEMWLKEGLFTDCFCLIIWYSTGSCLSCYYFCKKKMVYIINPCFSRLFIQFSKTVLAVQWILNQLESFMNLRYWDFAIWISFKTQVYIVGFLNSPVIYIY